MSYDWYVFFTMCVLPVIGGWTGFYCGVEAGEARQKNRTELYRWKELQAAKKAGRAATPLTEQERANLHNPWPEGILTYLAQRHERAVQEADARLLFKEALAEAMSDPSMRAILKGLADKEEKE